MTKKDWVWSANDWVWGAGDSGIAYLKHINEKYWLKKEVMGFIDSNPELWGKKIFSLPIISPDDIDFFIKESHNIVISIMDERVRPEIYHTLIKMGIDKNRICFCNYNEGDHRVTFMRDFACFTYQQRIEGSVAECGVFRGDFAARLNRQFYDRQLFLFDTFEGLSEQDIEYERKANDAHFMNGAYNQVGYLSETSIEHVMEKMPFPDNIRIKDGLVPKTFYGVDDSFCFVHLDMDLYLPTYDALCFFWGKMVQGGMILCHDYYGAGTPGIKKAVEDFETWVGKKVPKTPICDNCSIALLKG